MSILPREVFKYIPEQKRFEQESSQWNELDMSEKNWRLEGQRLTLNCDNGIYVPIKGAMFPYKACSDDAIPACNIVKSFIIESIKIATLKTAIPSVLLTLLSLKKTNYIIKCFNRTAGRVLDTHIIKDRYLSDFSRELHLLVFTFLLEYGIIEQEADKFAEIFVNLIEYDNAYRLRIEDILSETKNEYWAEPKKELKRLIKLFAEREPMYNNPMYDRKFDKFIQFIQIALYIPRVSRAFKKAVSIVDFNKMKLDECDYYWCLPREDYKFLGKTNEERKQLIKEKGFTYPLPNL